MRKLLLFAVLLIFNASFSQNELKARLEFEQAESDFNQNKYKESYARLNTTQELIGKWVPNVSYLKIKCLDKLCNYIDNKNEYTIVLAQEVKRYMQFANDNKETVVIDKFKEVYAIEEKFKDAANQQKLLSDPDFTSAEKFNKEASFMLALENYKKAADKGNSEAMRKIGNYYEKGRYVQANVQTATAWYDKAIGKGNVEAMVDLGYLKISPGSFMNVLSVLGGIGVTNASTSAANTSDAKKLFDLAAERGSSNALVALGYLEFLNKNVNGAINLYNAAAEKGNGTGYTKLGTAYAMGLFIPKNDETAYIWFDKAIKIGDVDAYYHLAKALNDNLNSKPKSVRATLKSTIKDNFLKYLELTNSAGDFAPNAQLFLGVLYSKEENHTEAFKYLKPAADAGIPSACINVSEMYKKGVGVEKNPALSKEYAEKAKTGQKLIQPSLFGN